MNHRGEALAERTIQTLETILAGHALDLVNAVARARRVSPLHLALEVPGLCHSHVPDGRLFGPAADARGRGCAFCARRGNCFAQAATERDDGG